VAAANLASEEMTEVVDDREDINKNQGGRCCLGKSSREGEKKKIKIAVDNRKVATGGGEREKNVHEKKKERPYEGKEDIEHVLEIPTCIQGDSLTWSSWGPVAEKFHRRRRWRLRL